MAVIEVSKNSGVNGLFTDVLYYTIGDTEGRGTLLSIVFKDPAISSVDVTIDSPDVVKPFGKN
jgi:hypothetical protein